MVGPFHLAKKIKEEIRIFPPFLSNALGVRSSPLPGGPCHGCGTSPPRARLNILNKKGGRGREELKLELEKTNITHLGREYVDRH